METFHWRTIEDLISVCKDTYFKGWFLPPPQYDGDEWNSILVHWKMTFKKFNIEVHSEFRVLGTFVPSLSPVISLLVLSNKRHTMTKTPSFFLFNQCVFPQTMSRLLQLHCEQV